MRRSEARRSELASGKEYMTVEMINKEKKEGRISEAANSRHSYSEHVTGWQRNTQGR